MEGVNILRYLAPVEAVEYNPGVSTRVNWSQVIVMNFRSTHLILCILIDTAHHRRHFDHELIRACIWRDEVQGRPDPKFGTL